MNKLENGYLSIGGLNFRKGPSTRYDFIDIWYNIDEYRGYKNEISLGVKEFEYIFGHGMLNCLTNNIDSIFEIQKICTTPNLNTASLSLLKIINYYKLFKSKIKKYFIKNYIISIKNTNSNNIEISIECQYKLINDIKREFKYDKCKDINFRVEINTKEALELINFAFSGNIKVNKMKYNGD